MCYTVYNSYRYTSLFFTYARKNCSYIKFLQYVCRKTLADSRPRVRGRFAKNDELINFRKTLTRSCGNNEEDTGENVSDIVRDTLYVSTSKRDLFSYIWPILHVVFNQMHVFNFFFFLPGSYR